MAGNYTKGYRSHRGRRKGSLALKVIAVILAVLLVAGVVFVVFLGRYVEYTDHGVKLNLPWQRQEASAPPASSDPVVIVTQDPSEPPEGSQELPLEAIGAVEVTPEQLIDGTASQAVSQGGGNALVVEMKGLDGRLAWDSQAPQAQALGVAAGNDGLARAIAQLEGQGELYLVARVCCFRDQALADDQVGGPLMTRGGNIWYDTDGYRWVSPVSQTVRDYLIQLCLELRQMGFDEIVLDNAGFPDLGEVEVLATSDDRPADRTAPVAAFLEQMSAALADTGTVLSLQLSGQDGLEEDSWSGLTPALLAEYAHRVWIPLPEQEVQDAATILEQAGMDRAWERIVALDGAGEAGSWATAASQQ